MKYHTTGKNITTLNNDTEFLNLQTTGMYGGCGGAVG
jgi:hypothetical protein